MLKSRDPFIALTELQRLEQHATGEIMRWQQVIALAREKSMQVWAEIREVERQRNAQES